jgi:hypothetical protein
MDACSPQIVESSEKHSRSVQKEFAKPQESLLSSSMTIAWLLTSVAVLLQMATNGRYGYFRDELYFIAASDHPAWGYVDFAPLVALLARVSRFLWGDSLHAIRLLPALAQGGEILLTALLVREFGGNRFATLLACPATLQGMELIAARFRGS